MAGALREILAKFGFDIDTAKLDEAKSKTDAYSQNLKTLVATIAGVALLNGAKNFVSGLREEASELRSTSQQLGLTIDELQKWQAASKFAGVGNEALATGFKWLQKNAAEAAGAGGDAAAEFTKLKITLKDSSGQIKPTGQLMREVGLAIGGMEKPALRTEAALKIFGRGGLQLIPLFNKGEEGLQAFIDRFEELGGGLSAKALANLASYSRSMHEFDFAVLGIKSRLAVELIPTLTTLVKRITEGTLDLVEIAKKANVFTAAVTVLGTAAALAAVRMYAPYLPAIALFAALILLVDEVITLFQGGDTVIGSLIDSAAGAGSSAKMVDVLTSAWKALGIESAQIPAILASIAAAFGLLSLPLTSVVVAVTTIIEAFKQIKKLREEWDSQSFGQIKQKLGQSLGLTTQEDADKATYEAAKGRWERQQEELRKNPQGAPANVPPLVARPRGQVPVPLMLQGIADMAPQTAPFQMFPNAGKIPLPPPMIARPGEPMIQRKEITVKTQSDSKVTFSGPAPGKDDVTKGLADSGKAIQAAVLASLEAQK